MAKVKAPNPFHLTHPFCHIHILVSYKIKANYLKNEIIKKVRGGGGNWDKCLYRAIWTTWTIAVTEQDEMLRQQMWGQRQWNRSLNTQWATVQCSETLAALSVHYNEPVLPDMANWGLANFRHKPFHGNLLINTVTSDCVFAESTQWVGQLKNNAIETWITLNNQTTVQRTFSWDSGWEIQWSAAGLTFLF